MVAAVVSLGPSVCSYEWGVGWLQHAIENASQPIPRCAAEVLIRLGHHALTIPGVPVWVECAVASSHSHHAPVAFSLIRALGADALQHLPWLSDWLRITITTGTVKYVSTCNAHCVIDLFDSFETHQTAYQSTCLCIMI